MTVLAVEPSPSWPSLAACIGRTSLFYSTDQMSQAVAVAVCRRCPVCGPCLVEAFEQEAAGGYVDGVRGGLTAEQRRSAAAVVTR